MYYSAMLGISEMVSCGTTTILDMGSTHHYEQVFRAAKESGFRMVGGKAMMDSGDDVPQTLGESTEDSLNECVDLIEKWHDSNDGRLKYAFAPRFLLSCTDELMKEIGKLAAKYDVMVHTHASENKNERKLVEKLRGNATIPHLKKLNLLNEKTILVHCVWLKDEDFDLLKEHDIKIAHCPSSNMKLASGIADTKRMLDSGLIVSLGADGAPCNNNLSIFQEMRLAALLQKLNYGPAAVSAKQIVKMATIDGAKALYLNEAIGSLEAGKKADIVILDLNLPHTIPENQEDIYTRIVYEADSRNVESVMIDGKWVMKNRQKSKLPEDLIEKTNQLAKDVYERAID
jgi:cytosine/adenosine deaminase-related metal-dependent hydrolase